MEFKVWIIKVKLTTSCNFLHLFIYSGMNNKGRKMREMMKKGPWTPEEDELLSSYIKREGEGRWRTLPDKAGLLRCGKSCRLRWMNYLRPSLKRGHISPDEEDLILRLHRLLGNRWSLIAGRIPGRTDNEIKNYWNTRLSKKLISQGIDPRTHKPFSSSLDQNHNNICLSSPEEILLENLSSGSTGNDQIYGNEDDDDRILTDSPDDAFSSFLDSLINEEMCDEKTAARPDDASMNQHVINEN